MNISHGYSNYVWMGLTMTVLSVCVILLMGTAAGAF